MQITVLCNAGLALTFEGQTLFIDVPNEKLEPFCELDNGIWQQILKLDDPYHQICGFFFTHAHPDHYSGVKLREFINRHPGTPVFLPGEATCGAVNVGPFAISYRKIDHAPMDAPTPPHVVCCVTAEKHTIYIGADAKLDAEEHRAFLAGRRADLAFWNSMYLSQGQTRSLLSDAAKENYIYHMPEDNPDGYGLWKKCEKNLLRFGDELETVTVIRKYPYKIEIR